MSKALKLEVIKFSYPEIKGIDKKDINTHSLRAGGGRGCATFGWIQTHRIAKMGRRWSDTFKEYISDQLYSFYKDVLMGMKHQLNFVCVKGGPLRAITRSMMSTA